MPGVRRWSSRVLGFVVLATLLPSLFGASRAHGHITDETKPPLARVLAPAATPEAPGAVAPAPGDAPAPSADAPVPSDAATPSPAPPPPPPASLPPPSPSAFLFLPPLPPSSAFAQISVARPTERAWYDNAFWGGPPAGTALYRSTVAELGLTTNFAAVGEARGAVGLHYAQRGGYLAKVGSGLALTVDGYARVLGGNAQGYAARLVWGFSLGQALPELPILLDVGVASALLEYGPEVSKGAPLGFTLGLMVPLGRWAQLDGKANLYIGGDLQAEASLVGNLTNRFYAGAGAATWFGGIGSQFFAGVRL